MFLRRLGPDPHAHGAMTSSLNGCPDILELETGDFAIIGVDITDQVGNRLAYGASRGPDERIVRIPRKTLVLAKADIPSDA
jgi:acyl CoA:acetate/3-ketoacid CoA transferase alpha subunit